MLPSLILLTGLVLAWLAWSRERWARLILLLRVPLVFACFLLAAPAVGESSSLTRNLFVLETSLQVSIVVTVAAMLAYACLQACYLIALYGPERYRMPRLTGLTRNRHDAPAWRLLLGGFGVGALLLLPLVWRLGSQFAGSAGAWWWGLVWGLGVTAVLASVLALAGHVFCNLGAPRLPAWLGASFRAGYVDASGRLQPGHLRALGALMVTVLLYCVLAAALHPGQASFASLPALGFVLVPVLLAAVFLPALSFFLDRYAFPLLLSLVVIALAARTYTDAGHTFALIPHDEAPVLSVSPLDRQRVIASRAPDQGSCAVIVCAFGGGIQASAWTATVLTELHGITHGTLSLVSGVSGGSVGAMHYLEALRRREGTLAGRADLDAIHAAAATSSLGAFGWGLAFHDLRRNLPFLASASMDRGRAAELAWARSLRLPGGEAQAYGTLQAFARAARQPWMPAFAFNATAATDGRRVLLGTATLPETGAWRFGDLYPRKDMNIVTAARLSAAFPYVSPLARAPRDSVAGTNPALGDGGYHDNGGIVTAIEWAQRLLAADASPTRVALVLIPAATGGWQGWDELHPPRPGTPPSRGAEDAERGFDHLVRDFVGPLQVLLRVHDRGHAVRGEFEVDLLRARYARDPERPRLAVFNFSPEAYETSRGEQIQIPNVLSWHLTADERDALRGAWTRQTERAALLETYIQTGRLQRTR